MGLFRPGWSGGVGYGGPTVEDAVVWVWRKVCAWVRAYKAHRDRELAPFREAHAAKEEARRRSSPQRTQRGTEEEGKDVYQRSGNKGIDKGADG